MTALLADPVPGLVVRAALVLLFASAAAHKLRDRSAFAGVLHAYRLVPAALVPAVAMAVAVLELLVAAALAGGHRLGPAGALALLGLYSLALAVNLARGRRTIDCGCGALGARQPISEWLLVRNALLAGAAAALLPPLGARPLAWVDWLTVAGGVAVAACVWTAAHGLAAASHRVRTAGASS